MVSVLDTPFEMSLRVLLLISELPRRIITEEMLTIADTFSIYGAKFGITDKNLHGGNAHIFDEYGARRELIKKAVKLLGLRGLINVSQNEDGFSFTISSTGRDYVNSLVSEYAEMYRKAAKAVREFIADKPERELFTLIIKSHMSYSGGDRGDG